MAESTTPIGGSRETLSKPTQGEVIGPIGRLRRRIEREFWYDDPSEPVMLRGLRALAQLVALTVRGFQSDQHFARCGLGRWDLFVLQHLRRAMLMNDDRFHAILRVGHRTS